MLLLQMSLHTQTSQSTPVVLPAQTLRRSSQISRFGERLPQVLWLFRGFFLLSQKNANPFTFVGYLFIGFL